MAMFLPVIEPPSDSCLGKRQTTGSSERARADQDATEQHGSKNRDQAGHDEAQVPGLIGLSRFAGS